MDNPTTRISRKLLGGATGQTLGLSWTKGNPPTSASHFACMLRGGSKAPFAVLGGREADTWAGFLSNTRRPSHFNRTQSLTLWISWAWRPWRFNRTLRVHLCFRGGGPNTLQLLCIVPNTSNPRQTGLLLEGGGSEHFACLGHSANT